MPKVLAKVIAWAMVLPLGIPSAVVLVALAWAGEVLIIVAGAIAALGRCLQLPPLAVFRWCDRRWGPRKPSSEG